MARALLHDTIVDAGATPETIECDFGPAVAQSYLDEVRAILQALRGVSPALAVRLEEKARAYKVQSALSVKSAA